MLDRSGSMQGWKIVAARRALTRMVETLTERDRFTVVAFAGAFETPPAFGGQLVPGGDRQRVLAGEFLARIDANGGTEMAAPLEHAVSQLSKELAPGRDRILVLVTDGQVGNEDQILKHLEARARSIRIFTLGIDKAVNAGFLRRLSDLGGGASELVESEERLDEVMDQVQRHIGTPVLTGLKLEPAGVRFIPGSVVPGRLPDLFAGVPLLIMGRYQGTPQGGITLQGREADGTPWLDTVPVTNEGSGVAACVWARARLREVEDRYVTNPSDQPRLEREIVDVSLRFGVLCRFTAFVAVDRSAVVNPGGQTQVIVQPVEEPAGWGRQVEEVSFLCFSTNMRDEEQARMARSQKRKMAKYVLPAPQTPALSPPQGASAANAARSSQLTEFEQIPQDYAHTEASVLARPKVQGPLGWIQQLLGTVGIGPRAKNAAAQPVDPARFHSQVTDLLQAIRGFPATLASDRLNLLRSLKDRLEQLFRDLVASGETAPAIHKLGVALQKLQILLSTAQPGDTEINLCWDEIQATLEEYPAAPGGTTARREGFWK